MKQTLCAAVAAICWLFAGCGGAQNVNLLTDGPGSWIVYPSPPTVTSLAGTPMTAVFRHEFVLPASATAGALSWRCFKAGQLILNGSIVSVATNADWKTTARVDVAAYLRPGTNELVAQVTCGSAFPALNLVLEAGGLRIESDEKWESSLAGAVWEPAQLASRTTEPAPGNFIYGAEDLSHALAASWVTIIIFAVIAAFATAVWGQFGEKLPAKVQVAAITLALAAWALLFLHNCTLLPAWSGFDASAHLAYIQFIQEHKSLPSATQGWEMFQAPLYYIVSAALLCLFHLKALEPSAGPVLCLFNLLLGVIGLALIYDAMRTLFPGQKRLQIAGLFFAAYLPAQIYLLHYPTNEILGAVTTTAALCVCLRILKEENPGLLLYTGLGIALGAALSSKASAVAVLPAVFLALSVKAWSKRQAPGIFIRDIAVTIVLCGALGVWHYIRLWRNYGSPFAGNWDPAIGQVWWQEPGYRTPGYYLKFGESLVRPYFSGFSSFWDGLYSTWWGDGCFGGAGRIYTRTPWNYDLVTVGFVLALIPSIVCLTGICVAAREAVLRRRLEWLLLTSALLLYGSAIFVMSLKLPYYSQSRAMYALPVVLPFCAAGALGLDWWAKRLRKLRFLLYMSLGLWALTVYASFWIRPNAVQTYLAEAVSLLSAAPKESRSAFEKVLKLDPLNPVAVQSLANLDSASGHLPEAIRRLRAEAGMITNELVWSTLALDLGEQDQLADALGWAKRACEVAPDFPAAPALLCSLSMRAGNNEDAVRAGRQALRLLPQTYDIQFNVGLASIRLRHFDDAITYFSNAVDCSPDRADAHFWLGIALWNFPLKKAEAVGHISSAVRLSPQNAKWKATLEEMQKEMGSH